MIRIVKKPEIRRQEIVTCARKLFLEKDYDKTTLVDVVTQLGIAKGTVYHYFRSKEDLLDAVVEDLADEYVARLQKVLLETKGSALERLKALIRAGNVSQEQEETLEQLHRSGNTNLHTRLLAVNLTRMAPLFAEVIQQGCEEGVFCTEHPLETAEFFLASVQFLLDEGCYPWKQEDLMRRMNAVPSFLEAQLKAPKGSMDFLKHQ